MKIRPRVSFKDDASDGATLIEIVSEDRPGLLYDLANAISLAGCNIEVVMIDTEAHKALDVFYVTHQGDKLSDELQSDLKSELLAACIGIAVVSGGHSLNWTLWWLFVPVDIVLCLTPGPAVLLVLATALRRGPRPSVASTLGILSANAIYFALSATGLGALLLASYRIFFLVKWAGAAYLIYLGVKALLTKSSALGNPESAPGAIRSTRRLFADGLLLQLSNPKAIVFFAALLPQFIDPKGDVVLQVVALGITSIGIEFVVLLGYGLAAGRAMAVARQPRYAVWTNRVSGMLLIGAGGGLALLRRN